MLLTWNTEEPAFYDDFETYTPFAISFGDWTGIDADLEAAAPLVGAYPNRGVMQYAQIINPLTVNPTWWYDYPILRPYSGQQYVGFTRTSSGNQNDDWLISPTITVGTDNILSFMGKAADQYPERFMVYLCEVSETTPGTQKDHFTRLDQGNYETADYKGWHQYSYDLSAYAGKEVRFALRYISHYNLYGSFMLMIDDVYVGQQQAQQAARRFVRRSAQNPNETFDIYLDNELKGSTDAYEYLLTDVPAGQHTLGVQAAYLQTKSEMATIQVEIPADVYAKVTFLLSANSKLTVDGQVLVLLNKETAQTYEQTVENGKVIFPSLPMGDYVVNVKEGAFNDYQQTVTVSKDTTFEVVLTDRIIDPYNITATADEEGRYLLRWNQELLFSDSFEDYVDFATGSFGEWKTIDVDQQPVYPIGLGGAATIVSFPGSGTANNPTAIPPMVFNPWNTNPAMLPSDPAIAAPTGDKTIIFFSSQRTTSDKWLISPLIDIHEGYLLSLKAKAYSSYPESMEFCVSAGGDLPSDFTPISVVDQLSAGQWALYQVDLSSFVGQTIRLAVHYTSTDAFIAQIDDFTVGPENGQGAIIDYGNVVRYVITLDGQELATVDTSSYLLPVLTEGQHVVGIQAIYQNGASKVVEYTFQVAAGIQTVLLDSTTVEAVYSLSGIRLAPSLQSLPAGVYLVKQNGRMLKVRK